MNGVHLTPRELRVLAQMEETLGGDMTRSRRRPRLMRALRLPPSVARHEGRHTLVLAVLGLGAIALTLLGLAVAFSSPSSGLDLRVPLDHHPGRRDPVGNAVAQGRLGVLPPIP
ncbi:hypothetical protein [Streptomyces sp. V3I7]|uniref:hypothetical protein n=1 Tax=Streptomyces sp. V3I7 TaxID=3042278 RepID=UPI00277EA6F0|nr:hypothetical protein [Streptomyces sp. V3I7]MDQ0989082.1 hypothetical protein [Streptomyces sp. V3I7]